MKICCPTRDGLIDDHFGHCAYYTIFTVEGGKIVAEETMASPEGCGFWNGFRASFQREKDPVRNIQKRRPVEKSGAVE